MVNDLLNELYMYFMVLHWINMQAVPLTNDKYRLSDVIWFVVDQLEFARLLSRTRSNAGQIIIPVDQR